MIKHINIYNNIKTVIGNCTDSKKMVDLELLSIYVREMRYKLKIGLRNLNEEK